MLPEQQCPDPAAMRAISRYLMAVLVIIGLAVAFTWGVAQGRTEAPEMRCKGATYQQPDGSRTCEPRMDCPRGPR